jgi:hypothetical protein
LPSLSDALMQLLREQRVVLTPERHLRWIESPQ